MSRLGVLLASLVLALLLAEGLVRALRAPDPPAPGRWGDLVHRASEVPGLGYELVPGASRRGQGTSIRVNRHGMRDDAPLPAGAGHRIAALGDSFTFGFFVAQDDTWPAVLERKLAEARPDARWDVLNFGVGGYSTRDEARVLEHKALAFDPALVIVGYALNDPEIDPIQPLQRHFHRPRGWERSELLRLAGGALDALRTRSRGQEPSYLRSLYANPRKWGSVEQALGRIHALCAGRAIPAVLVVFPTRPHDGPRGIPIRDWADYGYADLHQRVARLGIGIGFHTLDLLPVFVQYPVARVMGTHIHPTARGHAVAAEAIRDLLVREALLPAAGEAPQARAPLGTPGALG